MAENKRPLLLALYSTLLIGGVVAYFHEFRLFLAIAIASGTLVAGFVMERIYRFFISSSVATPRPGVFAVMAVFSTITAVALYFTSADVGVSGAMLGLAVYCLQSFILERKV